MSRREKAALQVAIGLTAFLVVAVQSGTVTATTNGVELEQTIGTVNAVDPNARRISVITGCGHAVRVMVFYAGTACRIEVEGVMAPMTNLRRGHIVAVRYRNAAEPYAAESIATLPASVAGRPR